MKKGKEIVEQEYQIIKQQIQEKKNEIEKKYIELGLYLKKIRDKKLYQIEYESFKEFCEEQQISYSTARKILYIIDTYRLTSSNILPLSWGRAQKILPLIKKYPEKKKEIIEKAKEVPFSQLDKIIQEYKIVKEKKKEEKKVLKEELLTGKNEVIYEISGREEYINFIKEFLDKRAEKLKKTVAEILYEILKEVEEKEIIEAKEKRGINARIREFLDVFIREYKKYRKSNYLVQGAKDIELCKRLVKTFSLEDLKKALKKFFTLPEKKRWFGNRFTIGVFYSGINDLMSEIKEEEQEKKGGKYDDLE